MSLPRMVLVTVTGAVVVTRGRGEVLGQAGVAKASAYHLNRSIEESKK